MRNWKPCPITRRLNISALYTAVRKLSKKGYSFSGESHNFWELVYVVDGRVGVSADGNIYSVPAGKLVLHRPMEFHRIWNDSDDDADVIIISFAADFNIKLSANVFNVEPGGKEEICSIVDDIFTNFEIGKIDGYDIANIAVIKQISPYAQVVINRLENFILRAIPNGLPASATRSEAAGVRKYTEIVNCLNAHLEDNLSISEIAKLCSMSPSSVKQIFRRYAGMGVAEFYREMKINAAVAMLPQDMSVREIAQRLGFADANYFSTVFKRVTGKSPTEYICSLNGTKSASGK